MGSFSYTSCPGFFFFLFLSREFPSNILCCLPFCVGSFSYTSSAGLIFIWGVSLLFGGFIFYAGSFSCTSRAGFIFMRGVSFTHPVLALLFGGEFLLHIPCLHFSFFFSSSFFSLTHSMLASFVFNLGSFSYTSRAGFIFIQGVSLTHPVLGLVLSGKFLLHIPCLLFFCGEFLLHIPWWLYFYLGSYFLHIPCWLYFSVGSFSYTYRAGFIFIWGVSLTYPMLVSFLFYLGSFSYTSRAGFFFFLSGEFLLHTPCWLLFFFNVGSFSGMQFSLKNWVKNGHRK